MTQVNSVTTESATRSTPQSVQYLIVGAGPAGLQLAYFLEMAQRDYLVLEADGSPASFFSKFPRHKKLISINKVHTGYEDPEINLRWDWNSLISHDPELRLSKFTEEYFPDTADLTAYCKEYAEHFALNIRYNSKITHVKKVSPESEKFLVTDQHQNVFEAEHLVIATGVSRPYVPNIPGIELAENYVDMSVNPQDFRKQRVLIIGKGNSGFETADNLVSSASLIHIASPSPIKLAWRTKYVGHLRAVNNNFLDTYQLKSQNGILDADILDINREGDEFKVSFAYSHANGEQETLSYARVIVCTGFQFDTSIFDKDCQPALAINDRFPAQTAEWESVNIPGLYFAGVLMHMRDFKKKQSGFIHGFRHNVQVLHHILEHKYHDQPLPSCTVDYTPEAITKAILDRVNASACLWQQTGFLCDVVVVDEAQRTARYYTELPRAYVHSSEIGQSQHYYIVTLNFGQNVASLDPFTINRVHKDDAENADTSAFIHPIIRRYKQNLLVEELHIIEDLEAEWKEPVHIEPLTAFIKAHLTDKQQPSPEDTLAIPSAIRSTLERSLEPTTLTNSAYPNSAYPAQRKRLGAYLLEAGLINEVQLRYALSEQEGVILLLGEIMVNAYCGIVTVESPELKIM